MPIDSRVFRQAAAQFATGVTVIAFDVNGEVRGMTANSFTSVSLDPPLVLFCVTKDSRTGRLVHDAGRFSVNVLGDHQRDLAAYFAGAWKPNEPPRHAFTRWEGAPRLQDCITVLSCARRDVHDGGDHWIVVGEVVGIARDPHDRRPLLFYAGGYVTLETPQVRLEDAPLTIGWSGPWG
jgi:3-hydroxy-9,10-secoandrosta-1,3,5(10)-triene-9,17-dione monooxygenase reductase component